MSLDAGVLEGSWKHTLRRAIKSIRQDGFRRARQRSLLASDRRKAAAGEEEIDGFEQERVLTHPLLNCKDLQSPVIGMWQAQRLLFDVWPAPRFFCRVGRIFRWWAGSRRASLTWQVAGGAWRQDAVEGRALFSHG